MQLASSVRDIASGPPAARQSFGCWPAALLIVLLGVLPQAASLGGEPSRLIIPAYGNPCCGTGRELWEGIIDVARPGVMDVILNPNSGPGPSVIDTNYINRPGTAGPLLDLHQAGASIYGYVHTTWGRRDLAQVLAEIDQYLDPEYYRVNDVLVEGIFLDEVSNDLATMGYYESIKTHIDSKPGNLLTIGNPGTSSLTDSSRGAAGFTADDFVQLLDKVVTYENNGRVYRPSSTTPAWVRRHAASRFVHIVHSAEPEDMIEALRLAGDRNVGTFYITDDVLPNPYDRLPSYWTELLTALLPPVEIDELSEAVRSGSTNPNYDLNRDGRIDAGDRSYWVRDVANTTYGDANLDGQFDSVDLIAVFRAGQYEDGVPLNSKWSTGDWNGDGEFGSGDLVLAFQAGGYRAAARVVAEPSNSMAVWWLILALVARPFDPRRRISGQAAANREFIGATDKVVY